MKSYVRPSHSRSNCRHPGFCTLSSFHRYTRLGFRRENCKCPDIQREASLPSLYFAYLDLLRHRDRPSIQSREVPLDTAPSRYCPALGNTRRNLLVSILSNNGTGINGIGVRRSQIEVATRCSIAAPLLLPLNVLP